MLEFANWQSKIFLIFVIIGVSKWSLDSTQSGSVRFHATFFGTVPRSHAEGYVYGKVVFICYEFQTSDRSWCAKMAVEGSSQRLKEKLTAIIEWLKCHKWKQELFFISVNEMTSLLCYLTLKYFRKDVPIMCFFITKNHSAFLVFTFLPGHSSTVKCTAESWYPDTIDRTQGWGIKRLLVNFRKDWSYAQVL